MPGSNPATLRDGLEVIMREAGELARVTSRGDFKRWTKGHDNSPVSDADIAVNNLLKERLTALAPDAGWLSEETEDHLPGRAMATAWIVDPIDGTRAFIDNKPEFCVSVALVTDGVPALAAIFNPATDEYFSARAGGGAQLNGKAIRVSGHGGLMESRLLASRRTFERYGWLGEVGRAEFAYKNSIAYRMALVACGRYEAAISLSEKSEWDIAAADLLVREAGGYVTTDAGTKLAYNAEMVRFPSVIAAAPLVHDELLTLLRRR